MKQDITELFYCIDEFTEGMEKEIRAHQLSSQSSSSLPTRVPGLSMGEIITIILMFQYSPCRNFKYFYKVFKGLAALGKTTKGWFFGFKLHVIVDDKGNLIKAKLTKGNVDDRHVVSEMTEGLIGLLFGDKGYIDKDLFLKLYRRGLKLVTGLKKNMKNKLMVWHEKILLRKRSLIGTVFDYLKNKLQLEHTRHRSPFNMLVHVISTLIVYQLKSSKPAISQNYALPNP